MSTIPARHQAIAFNSYGETSFNDLGLCDCPAQDNLNYAGYLIQEGDVTPIQFVNDCEPAEPGADLILNGGFEGGTGETTITDWTRTIADPENTTVIRSTDEPAFGDFVAKWTNAGGGATQADLTQNTGHTFLAGELYLLEFYAKQKQNNNIGGGSYNDALVITIGGLYTFSFTPPITGGYAKFSRYIPMDFNGTDSNIVIGINTVPVVLDTGEMWVDNVSLKQVEIPDECGECPFDIMFNGDFTFGVIGQDDIIVTTFDGWDMIQGTVGENLTGGLNGSRCVTLANDGTDDGIIQSQLILLDGYDYLLEFYAKSDNPTGTIKAELTTLGNILTQSITDVWTKYSVSFSTTAGTELLLFINEDTAEILLDEVTIQFSVPNLNDIYVVDENENTTFIPESMITNFDGGFNVNIDWSELYPAGIPECFTVCIDPCEGDIILNGRFEEGAGNVFTNWVNDAPGGSVVQQTATGGIDGSRAVQIRSNGSYSQIYQPVTLVASQYHVVFWAKSASPLTNGLIVGYPTGTQSFSTTTEFKRFSFTFTATGSGDLQFITPAGTNVFITIDNVSLYLETEYQGYCSEELKLTLPDSCTKELIWYNSSNAYGINYDSGFTNVIRVGNNFNLGSLAYPSEMTKELNGTETEITNAVIKKQYDLLIGGIPEYLHDRLAVMVRHDHIFLGTKGLAPVEDTNYTVEPENTNHSCLLNATVTLAISGENLAEKSVNCSE